MTDCKWTLFYRTINQIISVTAPVCSTISQNKFILHMHIDIYLQYCTHYVITCFFILPTEQNYTKHCLLFVDYFLENLYEHGFKLSSLISVLINVFKLGFGQRALLVRSIIFSVLSFTNVTGSSHCLFLVCVYYSNHTE